MSRKYIHRLRIKSAQPPSVVIRFNSFIGRSAMLNHSPEGWATFPLKDINSMPTKCGACYLYIQMGITLLCNKKLI